MTLSAFRKLFLFFIIPCAFFGGGAVASDTAFRNSFSCLYQIGNYFRKENKIVGISENIILVRGDIFNNRVSYKAYTPDHVWNFSLPRGLKPHGERKDKVSSFGASASIYLPELRIVLLVNSQGHIEKISNKYTTPSRVVHADFESELLGRKDLLDLNARMLPLIAEKATEEIDRGVKDIINHSLDLFFESDAKSLWRTAGKKSDLSSIHDQELVDFIFEQFISSQWSEKSFEKFLWEIGARIEGDFYNLRGVQIPKQDIRTEFRQLSDEANFWTSHRTQNLIYFSKQILFCNMTNDSRLSELTGRAQRKLRILAYAPFPTKAFTTSATDVPRYNASNQTLDTE